MASLGIGLGRPSALPANQPSSSAAAGTTRTVSVSRAANPGRHPREASGGAFQMFTPPQIKQFREAFMLIDTDGDGKITEDDLIATFGNLGQTPSQKMLDSLLTRPGSLTAGSTGSRSINFTQFLTMFGHHLLDLADSEQEILEAFACFDEHDEGVVDVGGGDLTRRNGGTSVADGAQSTKIGQEGLRGWLRDYGDKMSDAELDRFFSGPFMDKKSQKFDYMRFAKTLKVNDAAEVEQQRPLED